MYFPCNPPDNFDLYILYIGKICSILEDCNMDEIIIMGDFNVKPGCTLFDE